MSCIMEHVDNVHAFLSTEGLRTLLDSGLKPRSNSFVFSNL